MASFPPIPQIVGKHGPVYEAYYKQADPGNTGSIGALDAANFMKKSGLKDNVLSQIWDYSDPTGRGYLEKNGFFVALKLISLAQNGQDPSVSKLATETPQPNLGPVEILPEGEAVVPGTPWAVGTSEKSKYDQVFDSLQPMNNMLSGDKVKPVLMNSKLPVDVLGRIWELSDIDKDGYLDRDEFAVAMHLVHKGMAKETIPASLAPNLIPPSKRKVPVGGVSVLPAVSSIVGIDSSGGRNSPVGRSGSPSVKALPWVVTPMDKNNYDIMFRKADLDMDGFVSGQEIRGIFLQSGLPNNVLAHIWGLCDMKNIGKLNSEQFALAMYLVQQKVKGADPPAQLTLEMVPPSMRPQQPAESTSFGVGDILVGFLLTLQFMKTSILEQDLAAPKPSTYEMEERLALAVKKRAIDGQSAGPYGHVADSSALKELDMLQKEIDEIKKEKLKIEANQQQQMADIRISQGEVQTLEKELNAVNSSLHQLESQKVEAQKCLDDLDDKKSKLETSVSEIRQKCDDEQKQIDALNSQIQNQAKSAMEQDEELNRLRNELRDLREEENKLEQKVEMGKQQLEQLAKSQRDLSLQLNQTKTRVQHLQDQYRSIQQGIAEFSVSSDMSSNFLPSSTMEDQFSTRATQGSPVSTLSDFSLGTGMDEDPFKKDPFGGSAGAAQPDPFAGDDPFTGDPFKSEGFTSDPFAADDPFKDAFPNTSTSSAPKEDPFTGSDPFGSAFSSGSSSVAGAFDPFGTAASTSKPEKASGDLFGSDPFIPQPAKNRPESPRPALPPKQKKAPPPRPAPPKGKSPASSPSKPRNPDPFGGFPNDPFGSSDPFGGSNAGVSGGGGDAITNFADFSPSKASSSTFSDDDLAWAFSSSTTPSSKSTGTHSKASTLSKKEQEEADFQYALKLSRGEIPD